MSAGIELRIDAGRPVVVAGERTLTDLDELMLADPALEPSQLARAVGHLYGDGQFPPIELADEQPATAAPRTWSSTEFGDFDLSELGPPRREPGGALVYYSIHTITGVPYRVCAQRDGDAGWRLHFEPLPRLPAPVF